MRVLTLFLWKRFVFKSWEYSNEEKLWIPFMIKVVDELFKKEIDKKEQAITEKYDKEINFTDMQLQKTIENIEKKDYNKDEKETKTKELKETICKVKLDIEKASNKEIDEKIKPARDRLEDVKEKTK